MKNSQLISLFIIVLVNERNTSSDHKNGSRATKILLPAHAAGAGVKWLVSTEKPFTSK